MRMRNGHIAAQPYFSLAATQYWRAAPLPRPHGLSRATFRRRTPVLHRSASPLLTPPLEGFHNGHLDKRPGQAASMHAWGHARQRPDVAQHRVPCTAAPVLKAVPDVAIAAHQQHTTASAAQAVNTRKPKCMRPLPCVEGPAVCTPPRVFSLSLKHHRNSQPAMCHRHPMKQSTRHDTYPPTHIATLLHTPSTPQRLCRQACITLRERRRQRPASASTTQRRRHRSDSRSRTGSCAARP
jgi:hypothetical protein